MLFFQDYNCSISTVPPGKHGNATVPLKALFDHDEVEISTFYVEN